MRAEILHRVELSGLVAPDHDLAVEPLEPERLAADLGVAANQIPAVRKAGFQEVLNRGGSVERFSHDHLAVFFREFLWNYRALLARTLTAQGAIIRPRAFLPSRRCRRARQH